jgi:hypothetical protein
VLSLLADSNCDRVGNITVSGSVISTNRPLLLQTHDLIVSGPVTAGTSFIRVASCPGSVRIVDIGGSGLYTGDLRISEAELLLFTAANLTVQTSASGGAINVYAVVATDVATLSDTVTLDARTSGASINFLATSEWRGLSALAGGGITVAGNISTTVSNLFLDGNVDSSGTDAVTISSGSLWLTASGGLNSQLVLQASGSGTISAVAPVYWSGSNGVQVLAATTISSGSGVVRLLADSDADGEGMLLFGASGSLVVSCGSCRFV